MQKKIYNNFFGSFGGRYVAEVLRKPLDELEEAFIAALSAADFSEEFDKYCKTYVGRPTPLLFAENASRELGGCRIYIKLEGLANTGAHKINNALGQALLARRMGKKRIIAETGAGQHGLATAAVCAKFGLDCTVYMGEVDMRRQKPNVFWMERFGARVVPVQSGSRTLKDAVNEALRDWASNFGNTHYLLGSALGPSPYPDMVREFQSVIGRECAAQLADLGLHADVLAACVGGGSNAVGFFAPFLGDEESGRGEEDGCRGVCGENGGPASARPRLVGVEAGGRGAAAGEHAARMNGRGRTGIVQGYKSLFLQDGDGQLQQTHSVSAGLDYPGIGPQLAYLGKSGRIEFMTAGDTEALEAMDFFARNEGIIFALESAHAGAAALRIAPKMGPDEVMVVNMSGRGDKDLFITARELDPARWKTFLEEEAAAI